MNILTKLKELVVPEAPPGRVVPSCPPAPNVSAVFFGKLEKLKDGDTQDYIIDKWHGDRSRKSVRLLGVDTREVRGPERELGLLDKAFADAWLLYGIENHKEDTNPFIIHTVAMDKYGRWLSWVWRRCDGACLNFDLLESGHGVKAPTKAHDFLLRDILEVTKGE